MDAVIALDPNCRYLVPLWRRIWPSVRTDAHYRSNSADYVTRFHALIEAWRLATAASSRLRDKISHAAFREIVNMGPVVVSHIIDELRQRPDFLYIALNEILPDVDLGLHATARTPSNMVAAWLAWADRNHVPAG